MRVGFIGLGTMGQPMAANLLSADHDLVVYNRTAAKTKPLVERGARAATSPREAAAGRELVITMLSDERALAEVLKGDDGLLSGLEPGALVVEMSTVGRTAVLDAAAAVRDCGGRFVDAPVSGTRGPAIAGRLLILAGGDAADVEAARPALSALGSIMHLGPIGSGAAAKLALNALGAQQLVAVANVLGLAERMGLDRAQLLDVIAKGPFASPLFELKRSRILSNDPGHDPDFTIALWQKDQRLALEEAQRLGYAMPQLEAVSRLIGSAVDRGLGEEDIAAIAKLFAAS